MAHVQKSLRLLEVRIDLRVVGGILRAPARGDGRNYSSQRDSDTSAKGPKVTQLWSEL